MFVLDLLSVTINVVGMCIVVWGALLELFQFLKMQYLSLRLGKNEVKDINRFRSDLASYILMGLEFMIAGDIVHTILRPDKESLIMLGAIVAIRTVISYFLTLEQRRRIYR